MVTLAEAKDKVRRLAGEALAVVEDPNLTVAEKKLRLNGEDGKTGLEGDIKHWENEVTELDYVNQKRNQFQQQTGQAKEHLDAHEEAARQKSIGEQFVESAQFKNLLDHGLKGNWSSGDIEIKTLLTEGTAGSPGGGYQITQGTPTLLPGIQDIRFRPLTIADLFPSGTTNSPLIRYLVESAVTNAAAAVAEGGLKPESALSFSKVDGTLHKLATFLPVTDEMLEDWAQARSYIDARLVLFIRLAEEAQLLSGDGTGANLVGLLNRAGLATSIAKGTAPSVAADNSMDAIYRQITAIRVSQFLEPDAIVIDPNGWQTINLAKATGTGNYFAGGPFGDVANQVLWGKRVAVSPAMAANTALVGAFQQGGQIFRKGGITVEASNSHADFFQRNQTALRAEERLELVVYRPGAFGTVTNL
jgi:HK97 family phage major capsid protein